jgi:hypothetical protein
MTLRVPFEGFVDAVHHHLDTKDVYLFADAAKTILTAGGKQGATVVICNSKVSRVEAMKALEAGGLRVSEGIWSVDDDTEMLALPYIAAVSYRANKSKTGVWVEAFKELPTEVDVLQKMMEEFQSAGEMPIMNIDDFREQAQTSVQILTPSELAAFTNDEDI